MLLVSVARSANFTVSEMYCIQTHALRADKNITRNWVFYSIGDSVLLDSLSSPPPPPLRSIGSPFLLFLFPDFILFSSASNFLLALQDTKLYFRFLNLYFLSRSLHLLCHLYCAIGRTEPEDGRLFALFVVDDWINVEVILKLFLYVFAPGASVQFRDLLKGNPWAVRRLYPRRPLSLLLSPEG